MSVELGDEVQDLITGFKGIAVCRHTYLTGCARISVQPKLVKGETPDDRSFDEPQLKVLVPKKVTIPGVKRNIGGVEKNMPQQKTSGKR